MTCGLGIAAVVLIFGRMVFQPLPNEFVDLEIGIFIALAGSFAVAVGGWLSMDEEAAAPGGGTARY
jgi:hypothetical protein